MQDARQVIADVHARYFGAELDDRSLIPGAKHRIAPTRFDAWLSLDPAWGANLMPRLQHPSQPGPMDSMICQMSQTARQSKPTDTPKQPNTPNDARCQSLSTSATSRCVPGCHATHQVAIPMSTRMTMHTTMRAIIHSRAKPTVSFLTSISPALCSQHCSSNPARCWSWRSSSTASGSATKADTATLRDHALV